LNEKIFVILINIIKLTQSANKAALWDTKKIYQVSPKAKTERRTSFLLFLKNNHPLYTTSYMTGLSNSSTTTDRHFKSVSLRPDPFLSHHKI
jgi:hypothetical protein